MIPPSSAARDQDKREAEKDKARDDRNTCHTAQYTYR